MCDILSYVRQNIIVRSVRCLHSLISSTRYAKPSSKVPGSARTMYLMFGLFGDTQELNIIWENSFIQLYPAVLECRSHRLAGHTHRVRDRANHQIADQALLQCETKTHFTGIVLVVDGGLLCCLPNRNPMEKFFSLRKLLMELVSDVTPVTVTTSAPNVRVYTGSTRRPRIYASAPQTWPGP